MNTDKAIMSQHTASARTFNLCGKRYAPSNAALVESLFQSGGTLDGTYKVQKNGIALYRGNGDIFAFIVDNVHGEQFAVSAAKHGGKIRYSFGLSDTAREYLRLPAGFIAEREAIKQALSQFKVTA